MKPFVFSFLLLLPALLIAQDAPIPAWVLADWERHAAGSGTWLADNAAYRSDAEPFTEYGTQWTLCPGKQCLRGRLFGKIGGQEVATFWEFFLFWDAEKNKVRIIQINGGGTVGEGWLWQEPDGGTRSEQRFTQPGGGFSDSGHTSVFPSENEMKTQSFDIVEGKWTARREYVWRRI